MPAITRIMTAAALIAASCISASAAGPGARSGPWLKVCTPARSCIVQAQLRDASHRVTAAFAVLTEPKQIPKVSVRFPNDPKFRKADIMAFQIDDEPPHTFITDGCGSSAICGGLLPIVSFFVEQLHDAKKVRTMLTAAGELLVVAEFDMAGYASVADSKDYLTPDELTELVKSGEW